MANGTPCPLGKVIAHVMQGEAISFPIEGVGGSSISMLAV
jgi:hypothetical protein